MGMQIYSTKDNQWREYYNPLRGLGLPRLVSLIDAGDRGQYADLQWCYYFMERADPMVFSVLQRRRAALLECDWDVRQVSADAPVVRHAGRRLRTVGPVDAVLAEEQAACLRSVYERIENFDEAVSFLFTGICRGFAHLEKHYDATGGVVRLEPVEQWFWVRDGMFADWEYNQNAVSGRRRGVAIDPANFLILEATALDRMFSLLYLRRVLGQRDWDGYLDIFGTPATFLIGPPNAVGEKEKEFQAIADQLFSNGRGFLPNGSDIKFVNGGGGRAPYRELIEYIDRQIALVGTGGLLTMLTEAGSGTLAGGAHSDTFLQIARGDAALVSGVFQRGIDLGVLEANFPGQPVLAYFQFAPSSLGSATAVAQDVAALAQAGFTVDPAQISEKTGYRVAPEAAVAPVSSQQLAVGSEQLRNTGWTNEAREASLEVRRAKVASTVPLPRRDKLPAGERVGSGSAGMGGETDAEKKARLDALLPPDLGPAIRAEKLRMITKGNDDWVAGVKMLYEAIFGKKKVATEEKK